MQPTPILHVQKVTIYESVRYLHFLDPVVSKTLHIGPSNPGHSYTMRGLTLKATATERPRHPPGHCAEVLQALYRRGSVFVSIQINECLVSASIWFPFEAAEEAYKMNILVGCRWLVVVSR